MKYETRAVLAAVYRGKEREGLTHTVIVENGKPEKLLCKSVKLDSLADPLAMDTSEPPTCKTCLRKDARF